MQDITKEIIDRISESYKVELKAAESNLPKAFWETYSAFCNTEGGMIILGVKENKEGNHITGVKNAEQIQRDLWNQLANKNKVSYNSLVNDSVQVLEIEDKTVICIEVPEVDALDKPVYLNNNYKEAYIRTGDGDRKITEEQLRAFLRNARPIMDSEIAEGISMDDLDVATIASYKERVVARYPNRLSAELNQEEFLDRINAIERRQDGRMAIKKGTLLFFGKYKAIKRVFPSYFLDYQSRVSSNARWTDRIATDEIYDVEMNIYNFYNVVFEKLRATVTESFSLGDNLTRLANNFDVVMREALINCLAHADYEMAAFQIKIIAYNGWISFSNPGQMLISKKQFIKGGRSVLRNELIMTMFRYLGLSERQGGGGQEIFETAVKNEYRLPEIETTINETELRIWHIDLYDAYPELNDEERAVFKFICKAGAPVSTKNIQTELRYTEYQTRKTLSALEEGGKIVKSGNGKSTRYYLSVSVPEAVTQLQLLINELRNRMA